MIKSLLILFVLVYQLLIGGTALAVNNNPPGFISVVNPVRGEEYWDFPDQQPVTAVNKQLEIARDKSVPMTWLVRFDALRDPEITKSLRSAPVDHEIGLFLEVLPSLTENADVKYHETGAWHLAGSVFLTGYTQEDRVKLIDAAFNTFKETYGYFPKSVGSWWIDSYSLSYIQKKYRVNGAMIVADQFTTDNYQIWGQYFSTPYYPSKRSTLLPAQNLESKIPVVITQWAARDPLNGYGDGVQESTYSVQANDYLDYHDLDTSYFNSLLDIYLKQPLNKFGQVVIGLENSYSWQKYGGEYRNQIESVVQRRQTGEVEIVTLAKFSDWYQKQFPIASPAHILVTKDPLNSDYQSVWFMNPYYRLGWFYTPQGSVVRNIRQYVDGEIEPCFEKVCEFLRVSDNIIRNLDDVREGSRIYLDQGRISNLKVERQGNDLLLSYQNEVDSEKSIRFMPRDIAINGVGRTIDGTIASAERSTPQAVEDQDPELYHKYQANLLEFGLNVLKFAVFIVLVFIVPGFILTRSISVGSRVTQIFLAVVTGMVTLTLAGYLFGLLDVPYLIWLYIFVMFVISVKSGLITWLKSLLRTGDINWGLIFLISIGVIFQTGLIAKSGWPHPYGLGFWGPLGHDGIWHLGLINELIRQVPPVNPGFAPEILSNYHYFYDLLVARTYQLSSIPTLDLVFRLYPVLFSVLLGIGTYHLTLKISNSRLSAMFATFFIYFGSSFGWIVDLLKRRELGGESAFWVNQPVSFNINPPFAISLLIIIAAVFVLGALRESKSWRLILTGILLIGSLIEFKAYGGVLFLLALGVIAIIKLILSRDLSLFKILFPSGVLSLLVFLPQNSKSSELLVYSPFWFIHSMIDYSDRVGWERLSMAREAYLQRREYLKWVLAEGLGLAVFLVGNFGTRVIALFGLLKVFPKSFKALEWQILGLILVFSVVIPILFIQKGNPWNTIQFFYYGLFVMGVFAGIGLASTFRKLPRFIGVVLIVTVMLLTPISSVTTFKNVFIGNAPARLSFGEYEALTYLKAQPEGVVLTYPYDKDLRGRFSDPYKLLVYETSGYVAAFSNHPVYLEDEIQQEILQKNHVKRRVAVKDFFSRPNNEFLNDNDIQYIYLPKLYGLSLSGGNVKLSKIFENDEVIIFQNP